jgi:hypothetical protein
MTSDAPTTTAHSGPETETMEATSLDALDEQDLGARAEAAGERTWLRDRRLEAYKTWADQRWPQLRGDEYWKDTPFTRYAVDVPVVHANGLADPVASPLLDSIELAASAQIRSGRTVILGCAEAERYGDLTVLVGDGGVRRGCRASLGRRRAHQMTLSVRVSHCFIKELECSGLFYWITASFPARLPHEGMSSLLPMPRARPGNLYTY